MSSDLISKTFAVSDSVENGRLLTDVLAHMMSEVGELSTEVMIACGRSYKEPDKDGVVGEAVDVILCALDIIRLYDPTADVESIVDIADAKLKKWVEKEEEIRNRPYWIDLPRSE